MAGEFEGLQAFGVVAACRAVRLEELGQIVSALSAERATLIKLPKLAELRRELQDHALGDLVAEPLDAVVAELRADGHDVTGVVTDVSDLSSVEHLRDRAYEAYGAVHVLCNNAADGAGAVGMVW